MKRILSVFLLCSCIGAIALPASIATPVNIAQFRLSYDKYMQIGYAANARRDYKNALINFRKALKLRPGDKYASRAISNVSRYAQALRLGQLYTFVPANRGTPNNRSSGGTRGCMNAGSEQLIALIPEKEALTTAEYPSLFFICRNIQPKLWNLCCLTTRSAKFTRQILLLTKKQELCALI